MMVIYAWLAVVLFLAAPLLGILYILFVEKPREQATRRAAELPGTSPLLPAWVEDVEEALERLGGQD